MAREHSGCEVWQQDLFGLDLPDARFDGVFANAVLFHVPARSCRASCTSCMRPSSRAACCSARTRTAATRGLEPRTLGAYHDLDAWRRFMTAAGFRELTHYYRPEGLPRDQQPWLASAWRALR